MAFITGMSIPESQRRAAKSVAKTKAPESNGTTENRDDEDEVEEIGIMEDVEEDVHELAMFVEADSSMDADVKLLKTLLLTVRAVIARIRRSPQAKSYFCDCCRRVNIPIRELLPFCNTRWESWQTVLERYLEVKDVRSLSSLSLSC